MLVLKMHLLHPLYTHEYQLQDLGYLAATDITAPGHRQRLMFSSAFKRTCAGMMANGSRHGSWSLSHFWAFVCVQAWSAAHLRVALHY